MAKNINFLNNNTVGNINTNFQRVNDALEDVIARSGELPNNMEADLDMDGNDILNVGTIQANDITIDGDNPTGILERALIAVEAAEIQADRSENEADRAEDEADRAQMIADGIVPSTVPDEAVTRPKLNTSLRSIVGFQYADLAALVADTNPGEARSVFVEERIAGNGGGGFWTYTDTDPTDIPASGKVQIDVDLWAYIDPQLNPTVTPEMFGAVGGYLLPAYTRAILDEYISEAIPMRSEYLRLLNETMQFFDRAGILAHIDWEINSGTDLVDFTADTGALTDPQEHAAEFIIEQYEGYAAGLFGTGEVVTGAMADAAEAINAAANTTAMQDFIAYLENGRAVGKLGAKTYPVNNTLNPRVGVTLFGVKGRSTIRAVDAMPYNNPLVMVGGPTTPGRDVILRGFRLEGNLARMGGSAGSVTGVPSGSVLSICYVDGGIFEDMEVFDGRKHAIDVSGASYNRSGTPGAYNPELTEISKNITVRNCIAGGGGDDCITTHTCDTVTIEDCVAMFSRGTDTSNSNGFEVDDESANVTIRNITAMFCGSGLQIKAHSDALPPTNTKVYGVYIYKCNNGVMNWHTDHGGSGFARHPRARVVRVHDALFEWPLAWIASETIRQGWRTYAYDDVEFDITIRQLGADPAYFNTGAGSEGAISLYNSAGKIDYTLTIEGFRDCNFASNTTGSAEGPITARVFSKDGPEIVIRQASTGAKYIIVFAHIERSGDPGNTGIAGNGADNMRLGTAWISGYTNPTSGSIPYS